MPNFPQVGTQTPRLLKPHRFTFLCVGYQPFYNKYLFIDTTVHHCIERFIYNIASKNVYSSIEMHISVVSPDVIASIQAFYTVGEKEGCWIFGKQPVKCTRTETWKNYTAFKSVICFLPILKMDQWSRRHLWLSSTLACRLCNTSSADITGD